MQNFNRFYPDLNKRCVKCLQIKFIEDVSLKKTALALQHG